MLGLVLRCTGKVIPDGFSDARHVLDRRRNNDEGHRRGPGRQRRAASFQASSSSSSLQPRQVHRSPATGVGAMVAAPPRPRNRVPQAGQRSKGPTMNMTNGRDAAETRATPHPHARRVRALPADTARAAEAFAGMILVTISRTPDSPLHEVSRFVLRTLPPFSPRDPRGSVTIVLDDKIAAATATMRLPR